jgi:hypothetical protein
MPKRSKPFFVRWPSARNLKVGLGSPFSVSGWDPDVSQNASDADKSTPNVRLFMFCNGSGYRNPRRRMTGSASGQPPWRHTFEIGKTHQRTQSPITGKPKKRAGREWHNSIIKNRTQMNADYLGKK